MDQLSVKRGPEGLFTGRGLSAETALALPALAFGGELSAASVGTAVPDCTQTNSVNDPFPVNPQTVVKKVARASPKPFCSLAQLSKSGAVEWDTHPPKRPDRALAGEGSRQKRALARAETQGFAASPSQAILRLGCLNPGRNWPGAVACSGFKGFMLPLKEKLELSQLES
ncbi:hypothetical protein E5288_WYG006113 [Bos mutus]|uniref:Uncharacterized protein n=1 Tax=Bos mutus TaxID=72004 RepID=A0A6B0RYI1_9CETA|nr:hypothetical protein [Bos mutus]